MIQTSFKAASRPRILFVDDEPAVLDGLRRSLSAMRGEMDMQFESDPFAAERLALENPFDVVVSDLRMPGMDGLTLLERLKAAGQDSQMIILSGTGDMDTAIAAINRIGIFRYYAKPCPADHLIQGITEALRLSRRDTLRLATATLDMLSFATLAVDAELRPVFVNRCAAGLLARGDLLMVDAKGRLHATEPEGTAALRTALGHIAGGAQVVALESRSGTRYSVLIERPAAAGEVAAVLLLRQLDVIRVPAPEILRRLFGLTQSESRLAHALASGLDIADAARAQGITLNSGRTYLRTVFQKMDVTRQADLIRIITSCVAG